MTYFSTNAMGMLRRQANEVLEALSTEDTSNISVQEN